MEEDLLITSDQQRVIDRNLYRSRLINLVRLNPILWDKKSPDFNQRVAKIKKWLEVAEQLGVSTDKIRRTWENLRDQYRRDLKRIITTGAHSKWRFFNDMNFIRSMVRIKTSRRGHLRQSDSESDYEELTNDTYQETISAPNFCSYSCLPTTSAAPAKNVDNEPMEFLPIKLNTEWKQHAAVEQLQEIQQTKKPKKQKILPQQSLKTQEKQNEEQHQQDCDSSEEQKYADDKLYEVEQASDVIKIEIDSDTNEESLPEILLKQQQQQDPSREPRPTAPRPNLSKLESEEFVSTSDSAIKSRKRRLSTQADANAEDNYQSCFRTQRPHVAQDTEMQDEDYHFVMSILPSLRQVARQRKFPLRSQIMCLISKELEESNDD